MKLSKKAIIEFQELVRENTGTELSYSEAETMAKQWLEFYKLVHKPILKKNIVDSKQLRS